MVLRVLRGYFCIAEVFKQEKAIYFCGFSAGGAVAVWSVVVGLTAEVAGIVSHLFGVAFEGDLLVSLGASPTADAASSVILGALCDQRFFTMPFRD